MEERNRILRIFYGQLEILESEHIEDLIKSRRSKEVKEIIEGINFKPIRNFILSNESFGLSKDEIREDLCYEMALYICCSDLADEQFFENFEDFQEILFRKNEKLATHIGRMMRLINLSDLSIKELIGIPNEKKSKKIILRNID